ncbi:hypothetical protein CDO73_08325 [Saccharibacillus sp. O23]|uniref:hypothetical protein n=1 Tax=Saccharibacillus sp. O23 TaxID=2009338 RepID=UPI000B4E2DC4|nr:hypothetical protein [Saccharibacillus sp. O23]OWR31132.1 hypothetical protein CDO73_08325 [Saccharibacillus sp. O23]
MKLRVFPLLALLSLLLSACSADDKPDSVTEDPDQAVAVKRVADNEFELRLTVDRIAEGDNAISLEAGLRYIGDQPEITIEHGSPLFIGGMRLDGKPVGDPIAVNTVAISKELKKDEWLTEPISLKSSQAQIKQLFEDDGEITLYAGFSAAGYENEPGTDETLALKAEKIPR